MVFASAVAGGLSAEARQGSAGGPSDAERANVDRAFQAFWSARDPKGAAERIDAILNTRRHVRGCADAPAAGARVRRRRLARPSVRPPSDVRRRRAGVHVRRAGHLRFDAAAPGSRAAAWRRRAAEPPAINRIRVDALPGVVDEISVFPAGWSESMWWSAAQTDNLNRILDQLKRTYNVDENRVYLTGASDGGTGAYFIAFKDTTPWASFLPLIGDMMVLASAVGARRWRDVSRQRRQQAVLHRQRRARSAVPGACDAGVREPPAHAGRRRSCFACTRNRTIRRRGGPTSACRSRNSCRSTRASRCRTRFRGRPSGPIATTARIGW